MYLFYKGKRGKYVHIKDKRKSKIGEFVNEKKQAIDFTVIVKGKDGQVFSTGVFTYELGTKRMELIISKEGTMYS